MNSTLTKMLYDKYPKLFIQKDNDMRTTCMCWGFECGDGWFWLIDQLCGSIQSYIDCNNKEQVEVTQVKEKFGTLSFYIDGADDWVYGMIAFAESMSASICEVCGSTDGVTQTDGWIKTLCKKCINNN